MQSAQTIPLRKVAWLEFAQSLSKWLTRIALIACFVVCFYVAGRIVAELLWPPAPVGVNSNAPGVILFGVDGGYRAYHLITPAIGWLGRILILPSNVQIAVAAYLIWHNQPGTKKLIGGIAMLLISVLFALAASMSCGC